MKPSATPLSCFLINLGVCVGCVNIRASLRSRAANVFSLTRKISHKEIHLALSSAAGGHERIIHTSLLDLRQKNALLNVWLCAEFHCFLMWMNTTGFI